MNSWIKTKDVIGNLVNLLLLSPEMFHYYLDNPDFLDKHIDMLEVDVVESIYASSYIGYYYDNEGGLTILTGLDHFKDSV